MLLTSACASAPPQHAPNTVVIGNGPPAAPSLTVVAESTRQWTGLTAQADGTLFVNYPRWSADVPISVARLSPQGTPEPFPDTSWNDWQPGLDPASHWVCVQSVVIDGAGRLWVLDPGNPGFAGVVPGAPKLVRFDLPETTPAQVISFAEPSIKPGSYLNDVRIDLQHEVAYLTDSGAGALIVVNLATGSTQRLLDSHPATQAEDITLKIQGQTFDRPVHADGLAYDAQTDMLYFQALRGRTLYRIPGSALRDPDQSAEALAAQVESVATSGAADGLLAYAGRILVSSLEHDAVIAVSPDGSTETLVTDPRIAWPDTFTRRPGTTDIYFTTAQIHLSERTDPYRIFKLHLPPSQPTN